MDVIPISWESIIAVYGPLGLGWPVAIYFLLRLDKYQNNYVQLIQKNTEALTTFVVTLASLHRRVEILEDRER